MIYCFLLMHNQLEDNYFLRVLHKFKKIIDIRIIYERERKRCTDSTLNQICTHKNIEKWVTLGAIGCTDKQVYTLNI